MTTEISYVSKTVLAVLSADLNMCFTCSNTEFNKQHEGIWNSRTMSFIPQPTTFSDGSPVDPIYTDSSGTYFDECVVCGAPAGGNRYCGASCEQLDSEGRA